MSNFKALNIESDSESDISIDDTKEIQIEDALKLYQNALQAHSKAAETGKVVDFEDAARTYDELFASDIFTWPESQIELRRLETLGPAVDDFLYLPDEAPATGQAAVIPGAAGDSGPSALPQILHLSHKNFAQFKLEALSAKLDTLNLSLQQFVADATVALDHFVSALDKDEGDVDLWRRSATVGEVLDSRRLARFCLEAVLDGDDEALSSVMTYPGVEESLAFERLQDIVRSLQDSVSLLSTPVLSSRRKRFLKAVRLRLAPYERLIHQKESLQHVKAAEKQQPCVSARIPLRTPQTWAAIGEALLTQGNAEAAGTQSYAPGSVINFDLHNEIAAESSVMDTESQAGDMSPLAQATTFELPKTFDDMFPGLIGQLPTVQPEIADAEPSMARVSRLTRQGRLSGTEPPAPPAKELPTRKRSAEVAALQDRAEEEGRSKSRRTRARDSTADNESNRQAMIEANIKWEYEQQLNELQAADDWMFDTTSALFEKIGVLGFNKTKDVRQEIEGDQPLEGDASTPEDATFEGALKRSRADLKAFLSAYNEELAQLFLIPIDMLDWAQGPWIPGSGKSFSLRNSNKDFQKPEMMPEDGLQDFIESLRGRWLLTHEVAYEWIKALLLPGADRKTSYTQYLWPEALKTMVVRTLVNLDAEIYRLVKNDLENSLKAIGNEDLRLPEMIQSVFELHLDVFCLIKDPNSGVNDEIITRQSDRLVRWSELAREAMHISANYSETSNPTDKLALRFFWAITLYVNAADESSQDHVIACMQDLRKLFVEAGSNVIYLQNNAVMPELSVATLDRETSILKTKDFFEKVTSSELGDPVTIIENLEPLLEAIEPQHTARSPGNSSRPMQNPATIVAPELVAFLQESQLSTRLTLWQRLRNAYLAIDYQPMLVNCYLRMIRMLLRELRSRENLSAEVDERQTFLVKCLGLIKNYIVHISSITQASADAFECLDEHGLNAAVITLGDVLSLLQVFVVYEDSIRVGQNHAPLHENGLLPKTFETFAETVHDTLLHVWIIIYKLLQEAIAQNVEAFSTPSEDKFDFLRCVHRNLGIRRICGSASRKFVRLLKDELFTMNQVEGSDSEQAQALYDLYGLNCFLNPSYELMEHNCLRDPFLDRAAAMQAVDLLLIQASKIPMKELIKHPIKDSIDRVHGAIARKKPTEAIMRNREIYRAFLRSPIRPVDLYDALQGLGNELPVSHVPTSDAVLASKGWYFLMGHISLSKFRIPKRTGPTPTEDVDIAIAFFMQDLDYSMDNWETWFRLAQAYDCKIEENVVWSADKLNNNMSDLVGLQRAAIHSYTMATALAYRSAHLKFETAEKMTELYVDFATRLYSSSREPFSMKAFALDDLTKFLSTASMSGKLPEVKPFRSLRKFTCWKLARELFQRAIPGRPNSWLLHYQLGKCLWKMFTAEPLEHRDRKPNESQILACFVKAIELAPGKKDSRDSRREPALEPHYKLVSIVYKMTRQSGMISDRVIQSLDSTPYANGVKRPESIHDIYEFIGKILTVLRAADKSNWHHRMIYRAAKLVLDKQEVIRPGAMCLVAARAELTKQMFTRTMVLQVWRPDSERAGRHFVYTTRYTRFFVQLLTGIEDRHSLEQLARRVRKRQHDLFEHSALWQDLCNAYLGLLREHGSVGEGLETACFSTITHEDFASRRDLLEPWMQGQAPLYSTTLDVLREVHELKKTNQGLMKPGAIDDLIGDTYALLFSSVGKKLLDEQRSIKQEEDNREMASTASPPRNVAMSISSMMNIDGASEQPKLSVPTLATNVSGTQTPNEQLEQGPVRKKVGIGRREIRTAAEACSQKSVGSSNGVANKALAPANGGVELAITSKPSKSVQASRDSSVPGSLHDDADDESELSELEEEEEGEEGEDDEEGGEREEIEENNEKVNEGDGVVEEPQTYMSSPSRQLEGETKVDSDNEASDGDSQASVEGAVADEDVLSQEQSE